MMFSIGLIVGLAVGIIGFAAFVAWVNKNPPNFLPW